MLWGRYSQHLLKGADSTFIAEGQCPIANSRPLRFNTSSLILFMFLSTAFGDMRDLSLCFCPHGANTFYFLIVDLWVEFL